MANEERGAHRVVLEERRKMEITGICEVESFDEREAILKTSAGEMTVEGKNIKIEVLDTDSARVSLIGEIDAIFYSSEEQGRKRLFGRGRK